MSHCIRVAALVALLLSLGPVVAAERHGVLHELWNGLPGNSVSDLTGSPRYAAVADQCRVLSEFRSANLGDDYGSRLTALLAPPKTGEYTFWLASDDGGELWLSTDATPATRRLIARVKDYTGPCDWSTEEGQKSAPAALEAGKRYLIQALQKEGGGADHVAVAWTGPGLPQAVIAAKYLVAPTLSNEVLQRIRAAESADARRAKLIRQAADSWRVGKTLPLSYTAAFPVGPTPDASADSGINVLVDQAHQTQFAVLWNLKGLIQGQGFRTCSSLASLDTVLTAGQPSRIRLPMAEMEPFAWWPTPEWNVVVTSQQDLNAQLYTEAERTALKAFIEGGGGLLVFVGAPGTPGTPERAQGWSLNRLLAEYGATVTAQRDQMQGRKYAALQLDPAWEVLLSGEGGTAVRARRTIGRGRVALCENPTCFLPNDQTDSPDAAQQKRVELKALLQWLAAGKPPVGGDGRMASAGGAGIYPELEQAVGGLVVYYAANQPPATLECIRKSIPESAAMVLKWLPTKQFEEPYSLVICAGGGGGWAINTRPKASAVIEYQPLALLSVFGHEFAHTMSGPRDARGGLAGWSPHGNQSESHAGWFQGKIDALFDPEKRKLSNRNCNSILELERKQGSRLDLATEDETEAGREKWGKGPGWTKEWWVFQKLDDRFGTTWYPRWYWVRATRWAHDPGHRETWDEMVEDMSIAVGEDLFPFYRKIGTSLQRDRLGRIEFQGKMLELPVCPLEDGLAGPVRLEPAGDYTRPVKPLSTK